jgi:hypothetical protein
MWGGSAGGLQGSLHTGVRTEGRMGEERRRQGNQGKTMQTGVRGGCADAGGVCGGSAGEFAHRREDRRKDGKGEEETTST